MTEADVQGYRLEMYRDPEDGSWVAEVPDLPGCIAGGDTPEEAVEMVADAIDAWIEAAASSGRLVPAPRQVDEEHSGKFVLRVPRSLHARLARIARQEGVSLNAYCASALAEAAGAADVRRVYAAVRYTVMFDAAAAHVHPLAAQSPAPYATSSKQVFGPLGVTGPAHTFAQTMTRLPEVKQ
jgi:antitoxin HicB